MCSEARTEQGHGLQLRSHCRQNLSVYGDLCQLQHTLVSDTSAAEGAKAGSKKGEHVREELITECQS